MRRGGGGSIPDESIDESQEHKQIVFVQLADVCDGFLNQFRIFDSGIEKLLWRDAEIVADSEEFLHGWERFAG